MSGAPNSAFDSHAADYDDVATSDLGLLYRSRVHTFLTPLLASSSRVLDIGCGTGLDALWLAERGHDLTAIDASAAMVEETKSRVPDTVTVQIQDIDTLDQTDLGDQPFDLVLANFGAINCSKDLPRFGRWLAGALLPEGSAVLVTMASFCPPELLQAAIKRDRSLLTRRRHSQSHSTSHPGYEGLEVRYWSAADLADELGPEFTLRRSAALGTFLPTFEQRSLVQARPRLLSALAAADRFVERGAARLGIGDHQVAVFARAGQ